MAGAHVLKLDFSAPAQRLCVLVAADGADGAQTRALVSRLARTHPVHHALAVCTCEASGGAAHASLQKVW